MENLVELFKQYYVWYFGIGFVFAIGHYYNLQKDIAWNRKFGRTTWVSWRGYLFTLLRIPFYPIFILDGIIKKIAKV